MNHSPKVLRQAVVDQVMRLPSRDRSAAAASVDILALAMEEARAEGRRQGHAQGFQAGYEEGLREGRAGAEKAAREQAARLEEKAAALQEEGRAATRAAAAAFGEAITAWAELAEADMVVLCYETIVRILGRGASTPTQVRAQVAHVLEQWQETGAPSVHVHPADVELLADLPGCRLVSCVPDPAVRFGGCMVRGANGALDARLDRVLEEVKAALLLARATRGLPTEPGR